MVINTRISKAAYNGNGFNFAVNGNFNDYFGITADFGAAYNTQSGVSLNNYTYTFGPVLSLRANKAYTPFVHALIGGDHATASVERVRQRHWQRLCLDGWRRR